MDIRTHRNQSVDVHQFAMVPSSEIPRSSFLTQHTHKTTFDENYLVPIYLDEVLPGDTHSLRMTAFARLTTPIFPVMDNMYLDTFFFFIPNRLVWSHWVNFMGEQNNPADSISFNVPTFGSINGGFATGTVYDYFGLPNIGQFASGAWNCSCLPLRAYNRVYHDWFRDENLNDAPVLNTDDGPDSIGSYTLLKRGKRHDYFTSALPWTQKGGVPIQIPLGTTAPVKTQAARTVTGAQSALQLAVASTGTLNASNLALAATSTGTQATTTNPTGTFAGLVNLYPGNLYADLSTATAATVNQLRQSFQIQRFLERDARSGSRYTELVRAHFGVISPDARLQRTEYLGGGTTSVNVSPIPQTSGTGGSGTTTPLGTLAAYGTVLANGHGFTQSFTEHGHIIGLMNIRGDITYQQGLRKLWSRATRYDFYDPAFCMLGEQSILNQELYIQGIAGTGATQDQGTFGYQERWAEYRYMPSMITGQFRSTYATPLDAWHLAEKFTALPALGATFIQANLPVSRVSAVSTAGAHFIFDGFFNVKKTRAMPLYSVPGKIDHF